MMPFSIFKRCVTKALLSIDKIKCYQILSGIGINNIESSVSVKVSEPKHCVFWKIQEKCSRQKLAVSLSFKKKEFRSFIIQNYDVVDSIAVEINHLDMFRIGYFDVFCD